MDNIKSDIAEMKLDVKDLLKQGAVHNELLRTHEARSLALQKSVELQAQELLPIKRHVDMINAMGKAALAITTGAAVYVVGRLLATYFGL